MAEAKVSANLMRPIDTGLGMPDPSIRSALGRPMKTPNKDAYTRYMMMLRERQLEEAMKDQAAMDPTASYPAPGTGGGVEFLEDGTPYIKMGAPHIIPDDPRAVDREMMKRGMQRKYRGY